MSAQADALMAIFGMKRVKQKKCKHCKALFTPSKPIQTACSIACAVAMARKKRENVEKAADRQKREQLKGKQEWLSDVQTLFNKLRRLQLAGEPCISCSRHHQGQYHAGHFYSVGSHPELRFEPLNVWKQCKPCNVDKHGNLHEYRKNLHARIGDEKMEWLDGPHEAKHYTIPQLIEMKAELKRQIKEIEIGL